MPWALEEPKPLAEKVALLRRFRGLFDADEDYVYGVFDTAEARVLGGCGLHTRVGPDAFEIGYWIRADAARRGYATELTAALTRVGLEIVGAERIELHVDPRNEASLGVPRKLAFAEEATLRRRLLNVTPAGARADMAVFTLFADELPRSPAASAAFAAFDATGARIE
jgi:RimJ/RimL family protein N-acetyltransferase